MKAILDEIAATTIAAPKAAGTQVLPRAVMRSRSLSTSRRLTSLTLFFSDMLVLCTVLNVLLIVASLGEIVLPEFGTIVLAMLMFPVAYTLRGLYNPVVLRPEKELRVLGKTTIVIFVALMVVGAILTPITWNFALLAGIAGPLLFVLVPLMRMLTRVMFSRASWWGVSVIVLAEEGRGQEVIRTLKRAPELGLRPAALLQSGTSRGEFYGVPILSNVHLYRALAKTHKIPCVMLALDEMEERQVIQDLRERPLFDRVFYFNQGSREVHPAWLNIHALNTGYRGGIRRHWSMRQTITKRIFDFIGAGLGIVVAMPLLLAIAVMIKFTSKGPVLYKQERMGRKGRLFKVWKFRTMHLDAEKKLMEILRNDPVQRKEYETFHKLRDDPRVTSVGQVLRRYSLDELPQLWNVFVGDLSLVGPRAYIPREVPQMRGLEGQILQCNPGITGLWQVSGRNQLSFNERVTIDVGYQYSRSLALDYYILLKTIPVVLTGHGAS